MLVTTDLGKYASHVQLAYEHNKDPTQASNFHKHRQKEERKKRKRKKRKGKKKNRWPYSISFLTIWNKISMWHLYLMHSMVIYQRCKEHAETIFIASISACQLRSCWLFIKELGERNISRYLDRLTAFHCDSRWMDWAAGKMKKSADSKALLSDIFLQATMSFQLNKHPLSIMY